MQLHVMNIVIILGYRINRNVSWYITCNTYF